MFMWIFAILRYEYWIQVFYQKGDCFYAVPFLKIEKSLSDGMIFNGENGCCERTNKRR